MLLIIIANPWFVAARQHLDCFICRFRNKFTWVRLAHTMHLLRGFRTCAVGMSYHNASVVECVGSDNRCVFFVENCLKLWMWFEVELYNCSE